MTELQLENKLIHELIMQGYDQVDVKDLDGILINFRKKIELLNNFTFTNDQFARFMIEVDRGSIFERAVKLRGIVSIDLDDGTTKEIKLLDCNSWQKNSFEVTNQIVMKGKHNNRYDVTLLINGLPLVQIELKKPTVSAMEPLGQLQRYKRETMGGTLFDYAQLFIFSNGNQTMYCANNKELSASHVFTYADNENKKINKLSTFTYEFLSPVFLSKYISNYIILSKDKKKIENQKLLAMRSYQIHAVENIIVSVENQVEKGYVWHTTGSGKTLTSFKTCELISKRPDVDKVIFILDRVDLDKQTVSEYAKFQAEGVSEIPRFETTKELIKCMKQSGQKIVVTTINKLQIAVSKGEIASDLNVVLIFDECHRSQAGDTHKLIDKFFNNPIKFGFTGTPILADNANSDSSVLNTTEHIFGECLHKYLINDAIDDCNVLGFNIDYKGTFNANIVEDYDVSNIDKAEVINSIGRLSVIVSDIKNNHNKFTRDRKYNSMLAASGIAQAIKYYKLFKGYEVSDKSGTFKFECTDLKVACVFSFADNQVEKDGSTHKLELETIIKNYNQDYSTKDEKLVFDLETYANYKEDVSERMKAGEIDILIVSDMFLTGFDCQCLNTLYYDKQQKYHNLIQALSRTNRIYGNEKDCGNIISYWPSLKADVDAALKLFSNPNSNTSVVMVSYEEQLEQLNLAVKKLLDMYPDVVGVQDLKGDAAKFEFIQIMRDVNRNLNQIGTYREFEPQDIVSCNINMLEQYSAQMRSIYDQLKVANKSGKESILNDIDFEISLVHSDRIDYDFIMKLIEDYIYEVPESSFEEAKKKLYDRVEKDPRLMSKLELIKEFLEEYYNGSVDFKQRYEDFIEIKIEEQIIEFCSENNLDVDLLNKVKAEYIYDPFVDLASNDATTELIKGSSVSLTNRVSLRNKIVDFIPNVIVGSKF